MRLLEEQRKGCTSRKKKKKEHSEIYRYFYNLLKEQTCWLVNNHFCVDSVEISATDVCSFQRIKTEKWSKIVNAPHLNISLFLEGYSCWVNITKCQQCASGHDSEPLPVPVASSNRKKGRKTNFLFKNLTQHQTDFEVDLTWSSFNCIHTVQVITKLLSYSMLHFKDRRAPNHKPDLDRTVYLSNLSTILQTCLEYQSLFHQGFYKLSRPTAFHCAAFPSWILVKS